MAPSGPCFIDWPQAVETNRPHSQELLKRDLANVLRFFERKYGLKMPLCQALHRMEGAEGI
jgi:RIO kinase 2